MWGAVHGRNTDSGLPVESRGVAAFSFWRIMMAGPRRDDRGLHEANSSPRAVESHALRDDTCHYRSMPTSPARIDRHS